MQQCCNKKYTFVLSLTQKTIKMTNKFSLFILAIAFISLMSSCEKEGPEVPNEEELITTMTYTLTPVSGGSAVVLTFVDLDGDGGNAPTITGGTLAANTSYTGAITLSNQSVSPAEDITAEVAEEDAEHQFFFQSSISDLTVSYADLDSDGKPIGLASTLTTGNTASGSMTVILRHEPNKTAANVSTGDITNAGGESDIEVTFSIDVQ